MSSKNFKFLDRLRSKSFDKAIITGNNLSSYHYVDNFAYSILYLGKILIDLIPKIYDTERVMRIIGVDGKSELTTINEHVMDEATGIARVLNDVTVGRYDVVMETGPGYNSKREAAVEAMMPLVGSNQKLMDVAGDLVFRNMDWPGADEIAKRLQAMLPPQFQPSADGTKVDPQVLQAQQMMQQMRAQGAKPGAQQQSPAAAQAGAAGQGAPPQAAAQAA